MMQTLIAQIEPVTTCILLAIGVAIWMVAVFMLPTPGGIEPGWFSKARRATEESDEPEKIPDGGRYFEGVVSRDAEDAGGNVRLWTEPVHLTMGTDGRWFADYDEEHVRVEWESCEFCRKFGWLPAEGAQEAVSWNMSDVHPQGGAVDETEQVEA